MTRHGTRRRRGRRGFTLVEMMVAVGLMTIIVAVAAQVFKETTDIFTVTTSRVEIYQNARAILDKIETDLRMAFIDAAGNRFYGTGNPTADPPNRMANTDVLWFYTYSDFFSNEATPKVYRSHEAYYYLDDTGENNTGILRKAVDPGFGASFAADDYKQLGFNVANLQFEYFDEDGDSSGTWDASTSKTLPVAVKVTIALQDSTGREKQTLVRIIHIG
jgi:prepilin-type N-terminal cleavage/methylation domain-containing protein